MRASSSGGERHGKVEAVSSVSGRYYGVDTRANCQLCGPTRRPSSGLVLLGSLRHLSKPRPYTMWLASFFYPQQTRIAEHTFDLLVRLLRSGQRRPTYGWGDRHAQLIHRQLYSSYGWVAMRTE